MSTCGKVPNDTCSVCCNAKANDGSYFCSSSCQKQARRFRHRFDRMIAAFTRLGFNFCWQNGCQLETSIPEWMRVHYTENAHTFCWPQPGSDFDGMSTPHYIEYLDEVLGRAAANVITYCSDVRGTLGVDPEPFLRGLISYYATRTDHTFLCPGCDRVYLSSAYTRGYDTGHCDDCSVSKIPF